MIRTAILLLALAATAFAGAVPVSHFADVEELGNDAKGLPKRRMTINAYPKYYRDKDAKWATTKERFTWLDAQNLAVATEGVHGVTVAADGTITGTHQGRDITLRLRGFIALSDEGDIDGGAIDLSDWTLDKTKLESGEVSWTHPTTGAVYTVRYAADGFHDSLALTAKARTAIKNKIGATPKRVGLVFDCALPATGTLKRFVQGTEATDFDHDGDIELVGTNYRGRLRPAVINRISDPTGLKVAPVRERWRFIEAKGKLVQSIPLADLDDVTELRTSVTYQEGTDKYTGCTDTDIQAYSGRTDTNYGTATTNWLYDAGGTPPNWDTARALIRFDLSKLTGVTVVSSATLSLLVTGGTYTTYKASTAKILRNWGETTATWNKYDGTNTWTTAGCDDTTSDRTTAINAADMPFGSTNWVDWNVQPWVEDWLVDGNANYGVILIGELGSHYPYFVSRNNGTTANRPKLTIDYTAASATVPLHILWQNTPFAPGWINQRRTR